MALFAKFFNDEAADPQVEALPAKRITTDFYRVADLGAGVVVNSRLYAYKQGNGLLGIRHDGADTNIDPLTGNLTPDFVANWSAPKEDKNLTLEQAIARLEKFAAAHAGAAHDFSTPKNDLSIAQAKKFLAFKA